MKDESYSKIKTNKAFPWASLVLYNQTSQLMILRYWNDKVIKNKCWEFYTKILCISLLKDMMQINMVQFKTFIYCYLCTRMRGEVLF